MATSTSTRGSGVKYISDLPSVDTLTDHDVFVIDDGNHNYQIPWAALKALLGTLRSVEALEDGAIQFTLGNGDTLSVTPHDPEKQEKLTFDNDPTDGSKNPVTSGGIFTALKGKMNSTDYVIFKGATQSAAGEKGIVPAPTGTGEYLCSDGVWTAPDREPTAESQKLITSAAVHGALGGLKIGARVTGRSLSLSIK